MLSGKVLFVFYSCYTKAQKVALAVVLPPLFWFANKPKWRDMNEKDEFAGYVSFYKVGCMG